MRLQSLFPSHPSTVDIVLARMHRAQWVTLHNVQACGSLIVLAFQVSILVSDINDNAPEFLVESYSVEVSEGLSIGTPVLNLLAVDDDFGSNAEIVYSIASQEPVLGENVCFVFRPRASSYAQCGMESGNEAKRILFIILIPKPLAPPVIDQFQYLHTGSGKLGMRLHNFFINLLHMYVLPLKVNLYPLSPIICRIFHH